MKLSEVIEEIDKLDEDLTIYAKKKKGKWTVESEAVVAMESDDGEAPTEARGYEYFLEIFLAKEVLEVWSEWRDGKKPNTHQKVEAIVYYAENDAYLPD